MKRECHIVFMLTRNVYTEAITEVTMLNCFETIPQAKAALQYEYDIDMNENCDPADETNHPVWLNDDHTELKVAPGADPNYETIIYIDSSVNFHDKDEPCFKYGEESEQKTDNIIAPKKNHDVYPWFDHPDNPNCPNRKD